MWPLLKNIEAKWEEFANRLKIDGKKIDNIKANCFAGTNNVACCKEMLTYWRKATSKEKRTWFSIKKAAVGVKRNDLVKSLEAARVNGMAHMWCI